MFDRDGDASRALRAMRLNVSQDVVDIAQRKARKRASCAIFIENRPDLRLRCPLAAVKLGQTIENQAPLIVNERVNAVGRRDLFENAGRKSLPFFRQNPDFVDRRLKHSDHGATALFQHPLESLSQPTPPVI